MAKVRVYELARELNIETKAFMAKVKAAGVDVATHQSTLSDEEISQIRNFVTSGSKEAKPKVVLRRRKAEEAAPELPADVAAAPDVEAPPPAPEPIVAQSVATPPPTPTPTPEVVATPVVVAPPEVEKAPTAPEVVEERPQVAARQPQQELPRQPINRPGFSGGQGQQQSDRPGYGTGKTWERPGANRTGGGDRPGYQGGGAQGGQGQGGGYQRQDRGGQQPMQARSPQGEPRNFDRQGGPGDRQAGGATIVRRATAEEKRSIEQSRESRDMRNNRGTVRREDSRGTRVTSLGLMSERGPMGGPFNQPPPMLETDDPESIRRREQRERDRKVGKPGTPTTTTAEEEALSKKTQKVRRANSAATTKALLDQAFSDDLTVDDSELLATPLEEAPVEAPTPDYSQQRTVYTPTSSSGASRNKREVKRRKDLKKTLITKPKAEKRIVKVEGPTITVGELAHQLSIKAGEIIKKLMAQGVMATINQSLDIDTATLMAAEYQYELKSTTKSVDEMLSVGVPSDSETVERPPIVTVMGHVDHGKTSILDAIRASDVAAGEAGGITQHIGAYSVQHGDKRITFIDTPGHEAFSAMRARGAKVTDIVVLVVAADDGVMPQTVEAIAHAKAADVPVIVAVNKIDKPNLNLDRVFTELTEHGIQSEEWGGETQFVKVSALKKIGLDELLEAILLQAEVLDLKARPTGQVSGVVAEAHLDKGRGAVATILVQQGTLNRGDIVVAGSAVGKVRAMFDHTGKEVASAGPSTPVEILGLDGVPMAGDQVNSVADDKVAREVADTRARATKAALESKSSASSLEDLLKRVQKEEVPEVPIIVKGDTQGSVEAVSESILKIQSDKVRNRVVHRGVGGVSESDITLAAASGAIIIAFNVRAARGLDDLAERSGVVVKYFSIIYEVVDAVKALMAGKLPPLTKEVFLGRAEVRQAISVPKFGTIGGCAVLDGKILRSAQCRLIRDDIVIYQGKLGSLRRFKDDVKEVQSGYECGIGLEGYNDIKIGDVIEAFALEEIAPTL